MPAVEENARRGTSVRSSTNWRAGTDDRAERRPPPGELHVAPDPDRLPPALEDPARRVLRRDEAGERLVPLVAPDLEVHVHDVVVRDGDATERVRDRERPRLVRRVEVPDDAHAVVRALEAEGAERPRLQLGLRPLRVRDAALGDRGLDERLALAQGDVAVAEVEVAGEGDLDPLADPERAVRLDVDPDVGREQREVVRPGSARESECEECRGAERRS